MQLPGEISSSQDGDKSAEAIVIGETSRSANEHSKIAGRTHPMKGRTDEGGSDREPMDKNRIEGRHGASRWHNTPKATGMPVEVNAAAVRRSNVPLPGEWERSGHSLPNGTVPEAGKSRRRKVARSQQRS